MTKQPSIQIHTGELRIMVNDDPDRVIVFNPEDVLFVERFHRLVQMFEDREQEFLQQTEHIQEELDKDEIGAIPDAINLVKDLCAFLCTEIDKVFGEGTSEAAFQGAQTLNMFEQFFAGITPFINETRKQKAAKYITKKGK